MSTDQDNNNQDEQDFEDRPDFQVNTGDFFSSIPVLKSGGKRDHFSFEKFDGNSDDASLSEEGLDSFTEMLLNESDEEASADPANDMTQEIIAKNKEKWAKRVKDRGRKKTSVPMMVIIILIPVLILGGAAGYYFMLPSPSENNLPPIEEKKPDKKAKPEKKPSEQTKNQGANTPDKGSTPTTTKTAPDQPAKQPDETKTVTPPKKAAKKTNLAEMKNHFADVRFTIEEEDKDVIKDAVLEFLDAYPDHLDLHLQLVEHMNKNKQSQAANEAFDEWYEENPNSAIAIYLKAETSKEPAVKTEFLQKVIGKKPFIPKAYLELADIYNQDKNWREAEKLYRAYLKQDPLDNDVCTKLLELKISKGELTSGLKQVQMLLKEAGVNQADIATRLIPYAQTLEDSKTANNFLIDLKASPQHYDEYQTNNIINKAIYGNLTEDDFAGGFYPKEARHYHMMYLISKNRAAEVAQIPTPPKEYPDFWKIYLAWKAHTKHWKEPAGLLIEKYEGKRSFIPIITKVWLGKMSPDEAKKQLTTLSEAEQPILYLLLADYYRMKRKKIKAGILYNKAAKYKVTPYRFFIKSFADKF